MGTWADRSALMPQIERLLHGVVEGHLDPVIDRTFPVEDAAVAHQHLHNGANVGKVLLSL
jgi:NADPH:quinone reductase-like Zn-dependent oxidoreductase